MTINVQKNEEKLQNYWRRKAFSWNITMWRAITVNLQEIPATWKGTKLLVEKNKSEYTINTLFSLKQKRIQPTFRLWISAKMSNFRVPNALCIALFIASWGCLFIWEAWSNTVLSGALCQWTHRPTKADTHFKILF